MDLENLNKLWLLVEKLGPGATFILSVVCFYLWKALRAEQSYLRSRDKETLEVIGTLTDILGKQTQSDSTNADKILESLKTIAHQIEKHDERTLLISEKTADVLARIERALAGSK